MALGVSFSCMHRGRPSKLAQSLQVFYPGVCSPVISGGFPITGILLYCICFFQRLFLHTLPRCFLFQFNQSISHFIVFHKILLQKLSISSILRDSLITIYPEFPMRFLCDFCISFALVEELLSLIVPFHSLIHFLCISFSVILGICCMCFLVGALLRFSLVSRSSFH